MELGLIGIALVLLAKEAGIPIPVPGDLIILGAGVAAAQGQFDPATTAVAIVLATIAGGATQFTVLRGRARGVLLGLLERFGVSRDRIDRLAAPLARSGARGIAAARMTPGVRIVAIPAAALAGVAPTQFLGGLTLGNTVFSGGHYLAGFVFGRAALDALAAAGPYLLAVGAGVAVLGAAGWLFLERRRRTTTDSARATGLAWSDAACPACLVLATVQGRLSGG